MADEKRDTPRPFDVKTVEHLLQLMSEHDLSEVDLKEGDQRIRLRKGSAFPVGFSAPPSHPTAQTTGSPGQLVPAPQASSPPAPAAPKYHEIKSEMVGTFYSRPKPDKDEFVKVGSRVKPDTVVCLIEAMKLYNDIKAGISGTIQEVCVNNGDFVEFGTVLFRVDTGS
ncbi:MAG TPA: acetyl-CoA carboxylase biotin carboxyl carrier protein [Gemmataceae bacterium]|nr:acetyl-CoA carboxylase biotin carboxyl carrier protein [Gemmataceae bacterium]